MPTLLTAADISSDSVSSVDELNDVFQTLTPSSPSFTLLSSVASVSPPTSSPLSATSWVNTSPLIYTYVRNLCGILSSNYYQMLTSWVENQAQSLSTLAMQYLALHGYGTTDITTIVWINQQACSCHKLDSHYLWLVYVHIHLPDGAPASIVIVAGGLVIEIHHDRLLHFPSGSYNTSHINEIIDWHWSPIMCCWQDIMFVLSLNCFFSRQLIPSEAACVCPCMCAVNAPMEDHQEMLNLLKNMELHFRQMGKVASLIRVRWVLSRMLRWPLGQLQKNCREKA